MDELSSSMGALNLSEKRRRGPNYANGNGPDLALAADEDTVYTHDEALQAVRIFLEACEIKPKSKTGHNMTWFLPIKKDNKVEKCFHKILAVPESLRGYLANLMSSIKNSLRPDLCERVPDGPFYMFYDIDYKLEKVLAHNASLRETSIYYDPDDPSCSDNVENGDAADSDIVRSTFISEKEETCPHTLHGAALKAMFDELNAVFIECVAEVVSELCEEHDLDDFDVDDLKPIVLRRTCYKIHLVYPKIITNKATMLKVVALVRDRMPTHAVYDYKDEIDASPYSSGLRVIGATKIKKTDVIVAEKVHHDLLFIDRVTNQPCDVFRNFYADAADMYNSVQDKMAYLKTSLRPPHDAIVNFNIVAYTVGSHNNNVVSRAVSRADYPDVLENCFDVLTDQHIRDRILSAVGKMNTEGYLRTGVCFDVNANVDKWEQLEHQAPDDHDDGDEAAVPDRYRDGDRYSAVLVRQKCPFKNNEFHKRQSPTLYCILFVDRAVLKCFDCTNEDASARLEVALPVDPNDVTYKMQLRWARDAFKFQTHECIATVIFNWVKDRTATSPSLSTRNGYDWYYYEPAMHVWQTGMDDIINDVMSPTGLVQTQFKQIFERLRLSVESRNDNDKEAKLKVLRAQWLALQKLLQSYGVHNNIVPIVGQKLALYHRKKDPENRHFAKQLNLKTHLLATSKGVVDWSVEGYPCRPGRPDDMLSLTPPLYCDDWANVNQEDRSVAIDYWNMMYPYQDEREFFLWTLSRALDPSKPRQVFHILRGFGSDGKSNMVNEIIKPALGDYCTGCSPAMFLQTTFEENSSSARSDYMALIGKRIVFMLETNIGDMLNLKVFKTLTGNDEVNARELREKQTKFRLQCQFMMVSNHDPRIEAPPSDEATWRRPNVMLARHRFRETEADLTGEEFESLHVTGAALQKLNATVRKTLLPLLVHVARQYADVEVMPRPPLLVEAKRQLQEKYDMPLAFLNECTDYSSNPWRKVRPATAAASLALVASRARPTRDETVTFAEMFVPFKDYLKVKGKRIGEWALDKFEEYVSYHVRVIESCTFGEHELPENEKLLAPLTAWPLAMVNVPVEIQTPHGPRKTMLR